MHSSAAADLFLTDLRLTYSFLADKIDRNVFNDRFKKRIIKNC